MGVLALNLAEPHNVRDSSIHLASAVLALLALVAALGRPDRTAEHAGSR